MQVKARWDLVRDPHNRTSCRAAHAIKLDPSRLIAVAGGVQSQAPPAPATSKLLQLGATSVEELPAVEVLPTPAPRGSWQL